MMNTLLLEIDKRVATITLNRPDKLNAFNHELVAELTQVLHELDENDEVNVIVLKGSGRCFGSGYDVTPSDKPYTTVAEWRKEAVDSNVMMYGAWDNRKPVIAQVHGYCFGGACDLVMSCDLAVCADNAVFSVPELQFGTHPSMLLMPYTMLMKHAKMVLMAGDRIGAEDAARIGLVNQVVPAEKLDEAVQELAAKLVKVPTPALQACKKTINKIYELAGMRSAMFMSEEAFAAVKVQHTPESDKFFEIADQDGMKAAFKWRDAYFAGEVGLED